MGGRPPACPRPGAAGEPLRQPGLDHVARGLQLAPLEQARLHRLLPVGQDPERGWARRCGGASRRWPGAGPRGSSTYPAGFSRLSCCRPRVEQELPLLRVGLQRAERPPRPEPAQGGVGLLHGDGAQPWRRRAGAARAARGAASPATCGHDPRATSGLGCGGPAAGRRPRGPLPRRRRGSSPARARAAPAPLRRGGGFSIATAPRWASAASAGRARRSLRKPSRAALRAMISLPSSGSASSGVLPVEVDLLPGGRRLVLAHGLQDRVVAPGFVDPAPSARGRPRCRPPRPSPAAPPGGRGSFSRRARRRACSASNSRSVRLRAARSRIFLPSAAKSNWSLAAKIACRRKYSFLRHRIVLVVVAAGAAERHAQEGRAGGVDEVGVLVVLQLARHHARLLQAPGRWCKGRWPAAPACHRG